MITFLIGMMGISFCAGCLIGFLWKGDIDRRFEKKLQMHLIEVGQMADDEIEALQNQIKELKEGNA